MLGVLYNVSVRGYELVVKLYSNLFLLFKDSVGHWIGLAIFVGIYE